MRKFLVDYAFAAAVIFYTGFVHMCVDVSRVRAYKKTAC